MKNIIKSLALITIGVVIGRTSKSINHYQTKYKENEIQKVESWIQIDVFGQTYCISKKVTEID